MVLEEIMWRCQHLLHILSHLEENYVGGLNKSGVAIHRVYPLRLVYLCQEDRVRLPLGDHEFEGLTVVGLTQVVEVRTLEITQAVVYVREHTRNGTCTHGVPALILSGNPQKVLILPRRVVRRDACLINLRVLRESCEECVEFALHVVVDGLHRVYPRVLKDHVKTILKGRDDVRVLPVILDGHDLVKVSVQDLRDAVTVQVKMDIALLSVSLHGTQIHYWGVKR